MAKPQKGKKKKVKKVDAYGIAHVKSTFNNTIITITDREGNVVAWCSPGKLGYKGSKKSTPFAAQQAAATAAREVMALGMKKVEAWIKGPGPGREAAIRSLRATGLDVAGIKDCTPVPHNGVRQKKRRRI
ncbi:MAG: 30S ribosomal protein S11 [Candidatus Latescibacteria bacterium 4484_7]|nr:MAG: 30S ribosomal protein S11 [Candidatus Latescibacteria bacterium 4484_7]